MPGGDRTEEVRVAQQILQSLGLRSFTPQVTACPGCGRTTSTFFQQMAQDIQEYLRERMPVWRAEHPGVEEMKVAVMGCVVNGPGESKHADIGISLPGTFEDPKAPVYVDGRLLVTLRGDNIVPEFLGILNQYVASRYGATRASRAERITLEPSLREPLENRHVRRCSLERNGPPLEEAELQVGDEAPQCRRSTTSMARPVDLGQYIGRKPVLLEFWATWCESCQ